MESSLLEAPCKTEQQENGALPGCILKHIADPLLAAAGMPHQHYNHGDAFWATCCAWVGTISSMDSLEAWERLPMGERVKHVPEDFLRQWVGQQGDAAVRTMLRQAAVWSEHYNKLADLQMQQMMGAEWRPTDQYAVPPEVRQQLCDGLFAGDYIFNDLRPLFEDCQMDEVCLGIALEAALVKIEDYKCRHPGSMFAFVLICNEKASTVLSCSHSACSSLHYDSHCCNLHDLEQSASLLFKTPDELLRHLCCQDLYRADAASHVWAFRCECKFPCCAAPDLEDVSRGCKLNYRSAPVKPEIAPSSMVGVELFKQVQRAGPIKVDRDQTPPRKRGRAPDSSPEKTSNSAKRAALKTDKDVGAEAEAGDAACTRQCDAMLVYDDDEPDMDHEPVKKKTSRKSQRQWKTEVAEGKRLCFAVEISYHKDFAPLHKNKVGPGHWQEFLRAVAGVEVHISCKQCEALLCKVSKASASLEPPVVQHAVKAEASSEAPALQDAESIAEECQETVPPKDSDACVVAKTSGSACASHAAFLARLADLKREEGLQEVVKKGRKPKHREVHLTEDLFLWLEERRKGLYENLNTVKLHLKCRVCNQTFSAVRRSTVFFVLQHEAQATHHEAALDRPRTPCSGMDLGATRLTHRTRAHEIEKSIALWAAHGGPWHFAQYQAECVLRDDGGIVVRSKKCAEDATPRLVTQQLPFCASCKALCSSEEWCKRVCGWSYRIELAQLVQATFLQDSILRAEVLERMCQADWQMHHPVAMNELIEADYPVICDRLKELFNRIPLVIQTLSLRSSIPFRVVHGS
ncbi:unnamed protein product [Symbiodinium sp. CCMP2592]|nr:unnamed protein product [Symbiodinium sp. CCMP2592]